MASLEGGSLGVSGQRRLEPRGGYRLLCRDLGGWKGATARSENSSHQALMSAWGHGLAALDAAFWQALGKARGWERTVEQLDWGR